MKCLRLLRQKRSNLLNYLTSLFGENELKRRLEWAEKGHKSAARLPAKKSAASCGGLENASTQTDKRKKGFSGNSRTFRGQRGAARQETRRRSI